MAFTLSVVRWSLAANPSVPTPDTERLKLFKNLKMLCLQQFLNVLAHLYFTQKFLSASDHWSCDSGLFPSELIHGPCEKIAVGQVVCV